MLKLPCLVLRSSLNLQAVLLFALCSSTLQADWPEFRGPTGQGITNVKSLPTTWSETENVKWFCKTSGLGWSSPIVVQDSIYFTAGEKPEAGNAMDLLLVCLDVRTGEQRFSKKIFSEAPDSPDIHGKNSHASPTPFFHDGRIYVHFGHEGTACLDLKGDLIWENREHRYLPQHGNGSSPAFADGLLFLTCDGVSEPFTLALDAKSGKEVWQSKRPLDTDRKFSFSTPTVIEVNGKKQVISAGSDVVQGLDPKTGKEIWRVLFSGFSLTVRPLFHDGMLYVSTGFMQPQLLAIDPSGQGDVTKTHLRWQHKGNVPNTPSLLATQDSIVMISDNGVASAINAKTGKEEWRKRLGGNFSASPLLAGDTVYFQAEGGECVVMRLGKEPEEVSRNQLPGRIFASYAVVDHDLIIRAEEGVYRIGK